MSNRNFLWFLVTTSTLLTLASLPYCGGNEVTRLNETGWVAKIQSEYFPEGEVEYTLWDQSRVDLLLPDYAIEADWETKWAEGIGQASLYAKLTNRKPVVLILVKRDDWQRFVSRGLMALPAGFEMWIFDTRTNEWIVKPK